MSLLFHQALRIISVVTLLITSLCFCQTVAAESNTVTVLPNTPALSVSQMNYMMDENRNISPEQFYQRMQSQSLDIAPMPFNQGLTTARYLLGFSLKNLTQQPLSLQLATGASYRPLLSIHLFTDDPASGEQLLLENHSTPFAQRYNAFRHLNTKPFTVAPLKMVTLVLAYETIGSSYLPLTIGTASAITQTLNDDATIAAFFYSFCIAALLLFALFGTAMSDKVIILYSLLFLLGLLMLSSMEGFAFKFLWPNWPQWNHYSPLVLLYALSAFGSFVAWRAINPSDGNKPIRSFILLSAISSSLLIPLIFFVDFVLMSQWVNLFLLVMFIAHAYSMSTWLTLNNQRNHTAMITAIGVALVATLLILLSFDHSVLPETVYIHSSRIMYLVIMLATISVLSSHVRTLHKNHEHALQDALAAAEREASMNRELFDAEKKYTRAKEVARLRQHQLATASHDIKQPLVSLRSTIDALMHHQPDTTREQLTNAFNYLDNLCTHYLNETHPDTENTLMDEVDQDIDPETAEHTMENATQPPYSINLILSTAERMFSDEAAQKGISIKYCNSSVKITTAPMILMRLYSNLVSNAVKHTSEGRILLGVRRKKESLLLQVLDTGQGMSEQKLATVMKAYHKGPDSEGTGLGLAICQQLAVEHGLDFEISSREGRGTVCQITIPL